MPQKNCFEFFKEQCLKNKESVSVKKAPSHSIEGLFLER